MSIRLLVFGGRYFEDAPLVHDLLDRFASKIGKPDVVIHGGARGADRIGAIWAGQNRIDVQLFSADWRRFKQRAGPERNARMLAEGRPTHAIGFPGGKGSEDMAKRVQHVGIPLFLVTPEGDPHVIDDVTKFARILDMWRRAAIERFAARAYEDEMLT